LFYSAKKEKREKEKKKKTIVPTMNIMFLENGKTPINIMYNGT
jgi:hypothetical protein